MKRAAFRFAATLALLLAAATAEAQVRLIVDDVAPFGYREAGQLKGVSYELLKEMAARVGHSGDIAMVPLARELELLKHEPGAIGPVGRVKERERDYVWIVKLFEEEVVLLTMMDAKLDASTVEKARLLRIGVLRGGPANVAALDRGFPRIDPGPTAESNARKLAVGRIDAWLVAWGVGAYGLRQAGIDLSRVQRGAVVQRFPMYLAGGPGTTRADADKWRAALAAMKADGSYQKILRAYSYTPDAD